MRIPTSPNGARRMVGRPLRAALSRALIVCLPYAGRCPIRINLTAGRTEFVDLQGVFRPERATRFSAGQRPAIRPAIKMSPVRAARILRTPLQMMRAALTGLTSRLRTNVGLRPTLNRDALSGRRHHEPIGFIITLVRMGRSPAKGMEGGCTSRRGGRYVRPPANAGLRPALNRAALSGRGNL